MLVGLSTWHYCSEIKLGNTLPRPLSYIILSRIFQEQGHAWDLEVEAMHWPLFKDRLWLTNPVMTVPQGIACPCFLHYSFFKLLAWPTTHCPVFTSRHKPTKRDSVKKQQCVHAFKAGSSFKTCPKAPPMAKPLWWPVTHNFSDFPYILHTHSSTLVLKGGCD